MSMYRLLQCLPFSWTKELPDTWYCFPRSEQSTTVTGALQAETAKGFLQSSRSYDERALYSVVFQQLLLRMWAPGCDGVEAGGAGTLCRLAICLHSSSLITCQPQSFWPPASHGHSCGLACPKWSINPLPAVPYFRRLSSSWPVSSLFMY